MTMLQVEDRYMTEEGQVDDRARIDGGQVQDRSRTGVVSSGDKLEVSGAGSEFQSHLKTKRQPGSHDHTCTFW